MKERNDSRYDAGRISISKFKFYGIPVGGLLEHTSKVSSDQKTSEGFRKAREVLEDRGLIVLDTHHARFDVLASGLNILKELHVNKLVIPSSVKNLNRPFLKDFYDGLNEIEGLEIFPTFRKAKYVAEDEKKIYENMPEKERVSKNNAYIERAIDILKEPRSVVFLAVYGGFNRPYNGSIPLGVEMILKTGNPALCTLSVYGERILPMATYASEDLLYFSKNSSNNDMYKEITMKHQEISERAGFDSNYFKNSKPLNTHNR